MADSPQTSTPKTKAPADGTKNAAEQLAGDRAALAYIAELSYEQARDELVQTVAKLEQGSSTLEESLALWERGEALAQRCEEWLVGARARLDAARSAATPRADGVSD